MLGSSMNITLNDRLENSFKLVPTKSCCLYVDEQRFDFIANFKRGTLCPIYSSFSGDSGKLELILQDGKVVSSNDAFVTTQPIFSDFFIKRKLNFSCGLSVYVPILTVFPARFVKNNIRGKFQLTSSTFLEESSQRKMAILGDEQLTSLLFRLTWVTSLYPWAV